MVGKTRPTAWLFFAFVCMPLLLLLASEPGEWEPYDLTEDHGWLMDLDLDPSDLSRPWACTGDGVYRADSGGASWSNQLPGFFRGLVIDPQNNDIIYAGPHGPSGYGIYKSTDGGDTWSFFTDGMGCTNLATLAINPVDPTVLFTGSF